MIKLKLQLSLLLIVGISCMVAAQDTTKNSPGTSQTSTSLANNNVLNTEEAPPAFNGNFGDFILHNLKYPEVAKIVGLTGKVYIQFVVEKTGSVDSVNATKCLGAGCTSEAVRVISMSPNWRPGIQNGKPVRVRYTVPITFDFENSKTKKTDIKDLRKSNYGFVFFINAQTYTLDDAEKKLGSSIDPAAIENVEEYDNPKYAMPGKKAVYMIVMRNSNSQ